MSVNAKILSRAWSLLGKFGERARRIMKDPKKIEGILDQARRKAGDTASIEAWFEYLHLMFRLVAAYIKGEYRNIPYDTVALIVAAILYFLFPLDVLPDPIYVDDAAVLIFVAAKVKNDLEAFAAWEKVNA